MHDEDIIFRLEIGLRKAKEREHYTPNEQEFIEAGYIAALSTVLDCYSNVMGENTISDSIERYLELKRAVADYQKLEKRLNQESKPHKTD